MTSLRWRLDRYLEARRLERRYGCRFHPGSLVEQNNHHLGDSVILGEGTHIRGHLNTFGHGGLIRMGRDCYLGDFSKIWSACEISIGDRVLIAHGVSIFDSNTHPLGAEARHRHYLAIMSTGHPAGGLDLDEAPVTIEDDAWIGCNSVVLKGVTIGRGAIVGAGSVVTRDVAPFTVVAGNPARVVKELPVDAG